MKFIDGLFLTLQSAVTVIGLADTCNAVRRSLHNAKNCHEERTYRLQGHQTAMTVPANCKGNYMGPKYLIIMLILRKLRQILHFR